MTEGYGCCVIGLTKKNRRLRTPYPSWSLKILIHLSAASCSSWRKQEEWEWNLPNGIGSIRSFLDEFSEMLSFWWQKFVISILLSCPPEKVGNNQTDPSASPSTLESCLHLQEWAIPWSSNEFPFLWAFLHPVLFSKAVRPLHSHLHSWSDTYTTKSSPLNSSLYVTCTTNNPDFCAPLAHLCLILHCQCSSETLRSFHLRPCLNKGILLTANA